MGVGRFLGEVWRVGGASAANLFLVSVVYCGVVAGLVYFAWGSAPLMVLALLVGGLSGVVVWGAMHELAFEDVGSGRSSSIWRAFGVCWERYDAALLALGMSAVMMGVAGAFVLPAAFVGGMLLPFGSVVILERRSPLGGLMRVVGLIEGLWIRMALCWLVMIGGLMSVGLGAGAIGGGLRMMLGASGAEILPGLGVAAAVVAFPLPVVCSVAAYRLLVMRELLKRSPEQMAERRARAEAEQRALAVSEEVIDWYEDMLDGVAQEDADEVARALRRVGRAVMRTSESAGRSRDDGV